MFSVIWLFAQGLFKSFVPFFMKNIKWFALAGVVIALVLFVNHYKDMHNELKDLKAVKETADATIKELGDLFKTNDQLNKNEMESIDEINNAPTGSDGPIAPILRDSVSRLR